MESLIAQFMERYLPRQEIIHRLPVSISIQQFWPELEKERRKHSQELPLPAQDGKPFWFVLTGSIEKQCDAIAELARRDIAFTGPEFDALFQDAVVDEAVYSSVIEGAFTSREQAADFIRQNKQPRNKSEQMVKNNYDALTYVLEHLEDEISEETILQIAQIVTRSAAEVQVTGYRDGAVYVTGREGVVYTPPQAEAVPEMMRSLVEFVQKSELHPLLKACIAHFYFVYVHPFGDGNGRTARALSYMMLLQAGYDFPRRSTLTGPRSMRAQTARRARTPSSFRCMRRWARCLRTAVERCSCKPSLTTALFPLPPTRPLPGPSTAAAHGRRFPAQRRILFR